VSSIRRLMSSRANGALSHGPITPEGKRKSSQNAVRHGLLAKIVVTQNESRRVFDEVFGGHFHSFEPVNGVELALTENMAASCWRLRRLWALENKMFNDALDAADSPDELTRLDAAFTQLADSPRYTVLQRYAATLDRTYDRALRNMILLRAKPPLRNEPT